MGASIPAKVHLFANSINVRRGAGIGEGGRAHGDEGLLGIRHTAGAQRFVRECPMNASAPGGVGAVPVQPEASETCFYLVGNG